MDSMKMYTVSSIVGQEFKTIKGKKDTIDKMDGMISGWDQCVAFRDEHESKGHNVSPIRKWRRSSKTHRKSRSGRARKAREGQ